jgi:probable rRNA maturation factor
VAGTADARVRALNKQYRRRDYATDVLSFPAGGDARRVGPGADRCPYLGDIVIARGVARRQARAAGHSQRTELRILALHGLLHLLVTSGMRAQWRASSVRSGARAVCARG